MRPFILLTAFLLTAMAGLFTASAQFSAANTLGDLLRANDVRNFEELAPELRRMYIGNGNLVYYSTAGDDREFVFAGYFLASLPNANDQPSDRRIHVVVADKVTGRLQHGVISAADVPGAGSISRIVR